MLDLLLARRQFLLLSGGSLLLPFTSCAGVRTGAARPRRLGLIADLHHGLDPRAQERIEDFIAAASVQRADMIVQLGDFNYAVAKNRSCMAASQQFDGERHHVLGNHDLDKVATSVPKARTVTRIPSS